MSHNLNNTHNYAVDLQNTLITINNRLSSLREVLGGYDNSATLDDKEEAPNPEGILATLNSTIDTCYGIASNINYQLNRLDALLLGEIEEETMDASIGEQTQVRPSPRPTKSVKSRIATASSKRPTRNI